MSSQRREPAFMHAHDPSCRVCSTDPVTHFQATAAPLAPHLQNPETKGYNWYHGSHGDWDDDQRQEENNWGDRHIPEGGLVEGPESNPYIHRGAEYGKHWNTDLGSHWTSLKSVAHEQFSGGPIPGGSPSSRVATASLHMANPKHYDSEHELTEHAINWAQSKGLHYITRTHPGVDSSREDRERNDFVHSGSIEDDPDGRLSHLPSMTGEYTRRALNHIDENGPVVDDATHETYLGMHPYRHEIVTGFVKHLKDQGHDGIVYGNEHEGPHQHPCAIAFHDTPISQHKWEWTRRDGNTHRPEEQLWPKKPEMPGQQQLPFAVHGLLQHFAARRIRLYRDDENGMTFCPKCRNRQPQDSDRPVYSDDESISGPGHIEVCSDCGKTILNSLGKDAHVLDNWQPTDRLFAPTKSDLDPRLFLPDESLRPEVREAVMSLLGRLWHQYPDWRTWSKVYLAGSQASRWWGNNDFDILIGIEYGGLVEANPQFAGMSPKMVSAHLNAELRTTLGALTGALWFMVPSGAWEDHSDLHPNKSQNSVAGTPTTASLPLTSRESLVSRSRQSVATSNLRGSSATSLDGAASRASVGSSSARDVEARERSGPSTGSAPLARRHTSESDTSSRTTASQSKPTTRSSSAKTGSAPSAGERVSDSLSTTTTPAAQANAPAASVSGVSSALDVTTLLDTSVRNSSGRLIATCSDGEPTPPEGSTAVGPFEATWYCNPNSYDIRAIKPYAAYNLSDDEWAVRPVSEPTGHKFSPTEWYYFEGVAQQVKGALALPEPARSNRAKRIWEHIHSSRSGAFGPHGQGVFDYRNAVEKYLDQAGLWQQLVDARFPDQKTAGHKGLDDNAWHHLGRVVDACEQKPDAKNCYGATSYLAKQLGWEQASGHYVGGGRREGHYWNVTPTGTIVDPTHDQFDPDSDPVRVVHPGDPGQKDYERSDQKTAAMGWQESTWEDHPVNRYLSHTELAKLPAGDYDDTPMHSVMQGFEDDHSMGPDYAHPKDLAHGGPRAYVDHLKDDISSRGMQRPVCIHNGEVVNGHHRGLAAIELGMDRIPVHWDEGWQGHAGEPKTASKIDPKTLHPNMNHYRDSGMGGVGEDRSVVGYVSTHALRKMHGNETDRPGVERHRESLRNGEGFTDPAMVIFDPKTHHAYLGEGNHRVQAAHEEGISHVPVRVVRGRVDHPSAQHMEHAKTPYKGNLGEDYWPSDIHPSHIFHPDEVLDQGPEEGVPYDHDEPGEGRRTGGRGRPDRRPVPGRDAGSSSDPGDSADSRAGVRSSAARPLTYHPRVLSKDLKKMHSRDKESIEDTLNDLAVGAENVQTHKLTGPLSGWYSTKASRGHRITHQPDGDGGIFVGHVGLHNYQDAINRLAGVDQDALGKTGTRSSPRLARLRRRLEGSDV